MKFSIITRKKQFRLHMMNECYKRNKKKVKIIGEKNELPDVEEEKVC